MEKQRFMARLSCCHSNGYSPVECQAVCNLARFVGGHVEEASVAASHDVRWLSLWHCGTVAGPRCELCPFGGAEWNGEREGKAQAIWLWELSQLSHAQATSLVGIWDSSMLRKMVTTNNPKQSTFRYLKSYKIPRCPKAPKALKLLGPWSLPPEDCVRCQDWISDRFVSGQIAKTFPCLFL